MTQTTLGGTRTLLQKFEDTICETQAGVAENHATLEDELQPTGIGLESVDDTNRKPAGIEVQNLRPSRGLQAAPALVPQSPFIAALCVGINDYKNVTKLHNGVSDASAFGGKLLELKLADRVQMASTAESTTLVQLRREIDLFLDHVTQVLPRVVIVFFSGHGLQIRGVNYFVPSDGKCATDIDAVQSCLGLEELVRRLEPFSLIPKIIFFDCCRDAPLGSSWKLTSASMEQMPLPPNTKLVFSATAGQVASDGNIRDQHSPFTSALLKHLFQFEVPASQAIDNACVQLTTGGEQRPTSNGALMTTFLCTTRVEAPTFEPDGGVFVGRVAVKVRSRTPGATIRSTHSVSGLLEQAIIEPRDAPELVTAFPSGFWPEELFRLDTSMASRATSKVFDQLLWQALCVRYPFLVRPRVWRPHSRCPIFVLDGPSTDLGSDFCLRYVLCLDQRRLPAIRASTPHERRQCRMAIAEQHQPPASGSQHSDACHELENFRGSSLEGAAPLLQDVGCQSHLAGDDTAKAPSVKDAAAASTPQELFVFEEDGESVGELVLVECGHISVSAVASKAGQTDSQASTSKAFLLVTMDAVAPGFVFDVLSELEDTGSVSVDDVCAAIEQQRVFPLPTDSICDVRTAMEAMADADACSVLADPFNFNWSCYNFLDEWYGEDGDRSLLTRGGEDGADSVAARFRATRAGRDYLAKSRGFRALVTAPREDYAQQRQARVLAAGWLLAGFWCILLPMALWNAVWTVLHALALFEDDVVCITVSSVVAMWDVVMSLVLLGCYFQPPVFFVELPWNWECFEAHNLCLRWIRSQPPPLVPQLGCHLSNRRQLLAVQYVALRFGLVSALVPAKLWPFWVLEPKAQCPPLGALTLLRFVLLLLAPVCSALIPPDAAFLEWLRRERQHAVPYRPIGADLKRFRGYLL